MYFLEKESFKQASFFPKSTTNTCLQKTFATLLHKHSNQFFQ